MKRSTIRKSTFREIRQSFGRFFAILAIVALGVGFFAGLKVTKTAMVETTEKYLEQTHFYDYRLLSTLGFEEENVEFFRQQDGVLAAEGALNFDILYEDEAGNESAAKVHSLTTDINQVQLLAGRMPESASECVVDANMFGEDYIGSKIYLSQENEEEDLEHFAYTEYTVTGVVKSPLYIQFERGNTSLGTGRVSCFVYLLPEGFDVDYYTEIYVKFDEDFPLYSDAYEEFIQEKEAVWESLVGQAADRRYQRITADANEELADAQKELEEKRAEAEEELADARRELDQAAEELADGEEQLADAERELADAARTIADKKKELADAKQTIADKEAELAEGERTLQESIEGWNTESREADDAGKQIEEGFSELARQTAEIDAKEQELIQGEAALNQGEGQLLQQQQLLEEQSAALDAMEAAYPEGAIPEEVAAQLAQSRAVIAEGYAQVAAGLSEAESKRRELEAGKAAIAEGRALVAEYEAQLQNGKAQLDAGNNALSSAWMQIQEAQAEITEGKTALADAKAELADGEKQLADAEKELLEGKQTLAEKEAEFADGKKEYEDGLQEYEDGAEDFNEEIEDAEAKLADAGKEIAELKEPDTYVLGRDTNVGYVCFDNDSSIVEGIADVFPVFFFLVAALVCMTTMNRMVEEQRTQIGVLKALGYGESTIMSKYMVYSGTAAVTGCVLGFLGGTWLFPMVIWEAYGIMYLVDELVYVFDWKLALISLLVSMLCSMGVTWLSCRRELNLVAAQLMRPRAPKAGKRIFLEYLPFIWRRLGFLRKVSLRNIFRYKKRLFMMVIGISGCTALLITGFGVRDSVVHVADKQFEEIQIYDIGVTFSDSIEEGTERKMKESTGIDWEDALYVMESSMDVVTDNGRKSVNMVVTNPEKGDITSFLKLHTTDGEPLAYPGVGEAVMTHKIAENLGVKEGDTIRLQNEDMESITVKISGISQNFIYNYVYIGEETYREQLYKAPEYKTIYMNVDEGTDVHVISAAFMGMDEVASVTVNQDTRERLTNMMKSMDLIVAVIILCAAGLAFIVLYNLTNINITERIREIATIKVLGFYKRETASYVFRENILLTFMGAAAGLILGHYLHLFVMNQINIDMVTFDVNVALSSYVYSVLLTLVFAWFVNRFMRIKLEKVSMTESLKSVD